MTDYAQPDVLVTTDWVLANHQEENVKLVEVDVDTSQYDSGHIPGSVGFNWQTELQNQVTRDIISKSEFEDLAGTAGITANDIVVLYGDSNNWFAAYAFWLFKMYGHDKIRLMNGGRVKWVMENRELTTEPTVTTPATYTASTVNTSLRCLLHEAMDASRLANANLVDVRSPDEFTGKVIAPPGMSETAQRGGHIPGATSIPWANAVGEDGTFKSADDLRTIYFQEGGVDATRPTIAYCRIGERSSHTWFVLKYLLGITNVKNYDGSWTEYGNLVAAPIEKEAGSPVGVG